jgi:hypothetical protein
MGTNISKEPAASIFRVEVKVKSTLKMVAAGFCKILLPTYQTTRVAQKVLQQIIFLILSLLYQNFKYVTLLPESLLT